MTSKNTFQILIVASAFVLSFIFHIWMRTQVTQLAYGVGEAKRQLSLIEAESMKWQAQKSELMTAWSLDQRVNQWAQEGIFFKPASQNQIIYKDHE